ncbi:unnamed protein product [Trichobilharzia szidati]|nr:unnamed protein product [Trichobilharzia szidati]
MDGTDSGINSLFQNSEFVIHEIIDDLDSSESIIRQCFRATSIPYDATTTSTTPAVSDNHNSSRSNHSLSNTYPTNVFVLRENCRINLQAILKSILPTEGLGSRITAWTYCPFISRHERGSSWRLPTLIIDQPPLIFCVPVSSGGDKISDCCRWWLIICLRIKMIFKESCGTDDHVYRVSLHPQVHTSVASSSASPSTSSKLPIIMDSWLSPKIFVRRKKRGSDVSIEETLSLNVFAYTSRDIFLSNIQDKVTHLEEDTIDGDKTLRIYLLLRIADSLKKTSILLHLSNPLTVSLKNFIFDAYSLQNYYFTLLETSLTNTSVPLLSSAMYPFCKMWTITNLSDTDARKSDRNPPSLMITDPHLSICHILEAKLSQFCSWNVYRLNQQIVYFITNDPFTGLCLCVNNNTAAASITKFIAIGSSSRELLNLFSEIVFFPNSINDFQFVPYEKHSSKNDYNNINNNNSNAKSILDAVNTLINETECLINSITELVESTLHKSIPQLSNYLSSGYNNTLDMVHKSAEWRSIVRKASRLPVNIPGDNDSDSDNISVMHNSVRYSELHCQTDKSIQRLCLG